MKFPLAATTALVFLSACKSEKAAETTDEFIDKVIPLVVREPDPATDTIPQPAPANPTIEQLAASAETDPKAVLEKIADLQEQVAELLEEVVDTESAELALFAIEPLLDDITLLARALRSAEVPPDESWAEIGAASRSRLQEAMMLIAPIFMAEPSLRSRVQEVIKKLAQAQRLDQ